MATEKASAFAAVNACSTPTRLIVRPIIAPEEFAQAKKNQKGFELGEARENAQRFEKLRKTPQFDGIAGRYYLGIPDSLEIRAAAPLRIRRDDKENRLVLEDAKNRDEFLGSLTSYQGKEAVTKAKAPLKVINTEKEPLVAEQAAQRVLVSVQFDDPHRACAIEVEHIHENGDLIGSRTFIFRPEGDSAQFRKGCL